MELKFWYKFRVILSDLVVGESKIIQIFNIIIVFFYIFDYFILKMNKNFQEWFVDVDYVISRYLFVSIIYIKIVYFIKLILYFLNGNVLFFLYLFCLLF